MISQSEAAAMLDVMARMQDEHNAQVHPAWRDQGYAYYRAIWVECAEMLDHFGWKWWKQQAPDVDQVKLELVDIWHFALSEMLRADSLDAAVASALNDVRADRVAEPHTFREALEALAVSALTSRSFEIQPFLRAMQSLPLEFEELFTLYIGKNVLNRFRQDHGYKTGEYRKLWGGREDNEHLVELVAQLLEEVPPQALPDRLYAALEARYTASAA